MELWERHYEFPLLGTLEDLVYVHSLYLGFERSESNACFPGSDDFSAIDGFVERVSIAAHVRVKIQRKAISTVRTVLIQKPCSCTDVGFPHGWLAGFAGFVNTKKCDGFLSS